MTETINSGGTVLKDPDSREFFTMDWDTRGLETGVLIAAASSTWAITRGDTEDDPLPSTVLTYDNDSIVAGSRSTRVRLLGGTLGETYVVTNTVFTDESPSQKLDASFKVKIQEA